MAEQKIKRYFFRADRGDIVASDHGEWVRYEDVAYLIERPKADEPLELCEPSEQGPDYEAELNKAMLPVLFREIERLKGELEKWKKFNVSKEMYDFLNERYHAVLEKLMKIDRP